MRRLLTWAVVTLGIAALVRRLRRRSVAAGQETSEPVEAAPDDDPADELRRKLAESRVEEETAPPAPTTAPATVDERRASVHDAGRSALDEMRETDGA